jgi:hypothetical protein
MRRAVRQLEDRPGQAMAVQLEQHRHLPQLVQVEQPMNAATAA